jgi:UDP-glucose 4-epimerase
VYGPRQNPEGEAGVVSIFLRRLQRGLETTLFAYPGEEEGMVRDYVYVEDVARANLAAAEKGAGETFNIGTGLPTTTAALYRAIAAGFPGAPQPRREAARPGDLRRSLLDVGKAARLLDWKPRVTLGEGLARTGEFFRSR